MKNLKKGLILVFIISLIFTITNIVNAGAKKETQDFSKYKLGVKKTTKDDFKASPHKAKASNKKIELPTNVDHSDIMPDVQDQGTLGSCVGFATGYLKASQEYYDQNWGKIMFSPSFIYNQIVIGEDMGSYPEDAFDLLLNKGVCKLSTMPYVDGDYTTQPNTEQLTEAANFKAADWDYYYSDGFYAAKIEDLKEYLQNGCLEITIPIYDNYDFWTGDYDDNSGSIIGYHALCAVGYNDSTQRIKFINSWGTGYGENGYGYISYDLWNSFVDDWSGWSYIMEDEETGPIEPTPTIEPTETNTPIPTETATPTPTNPPIYKNKITFNGAKTIGKKGKSGAGLQWKFVMKNETKTTNIKYFKANGYPIWNSIDKSLISSWDGCYIKILEVDSPYSQSDYQEIKINQLAIGKNIIYLTVYEDSAHWTKWKVAVTREKVQVN